MVKYLNNQVTIIILFLGYFLHGIKSLRGWHIKWEAKVRKWMAKEGDVWLRRKMAG
jgi:hypothetical protein